MNDDMVRAEFARLTQVVRELREKCPWDREQTVPSLAKHLVEEAYEAADAIAGGNAHAIADELGDLLAQILCVAVIAEEESRFGVAEMVRSAADKLIRRHPHVYASVTANDADEVVANWNRMKQEERQLAGAKSALDGVVHAQPALMRAEKLGSRARHAGMDWQDIHAVLAKVREELEEIEGALSSNDTDAAAAELGDMLLAIANAPRFIGHSAEETLHRSCVKFVTRFGAVERLAADRGLDLKSMTPTAIEALWQEAKKREASNPD
jgi:tetrapyrrole methylase family protein / MazG family protein